MIRRATIDDKGTIEALFKTEGVWEKLIDDFSPGRESVDLTNALLAQNIIFLIEDGVGVFMFYAHNTVMWEIHAAAYQFSRGGEMEAITRRAGFWMFEQTPCQKIMAMIPQYNYPAITLARRSGMKREGTLRKAFVKGGNLVDLYVYGATKEEASCRS